MRCLAKYPKRQQRECEATFGFKPSTRWRVAKRSEVSAVWRRRLPSNNAPRAFGLIPAQCCQLLRPFSLGTFLLGQQKKSDSASGRRSKRPLRKRPDRGIAATGGQEQSHWIPAFAGMTVRENHANREPPPPRSPQGRGSTAITHARTQATPLPSATARWTPRPHARRKRHAPPGPHRARCRHPQRFVDDWSDVATHLLRR